MSCPPRAQAGQPHLVEAVDHVANGVMALLDQAAMTGTVLPPAETGNIIARRNRMELGSPHRPGCQPPPEQWS